MFAISTILNCVRTFFVGGSTNYNAVVKPSYKAKKPYLKPRPSKISTCAKSKISTRPSKISCVTSKVICGNTSTTTNGRINKVKSKSGASTNSKCNMAGLNKNNTKTKKSKKISCSDNNSNKINKSNNNNKIKKTKNSNNLTKNNNNPNINNYFTDFISYEELDLNENENGSSEENFQKYIPDYASSLLVISNLDGGIAESDLISLFEDIGPIKSVAVHCDRFGKPLGSADLLFENKTDAVKAVEQYNGLPLFGKDMHIQYISSNIFDVDSDMDAYILENKINKNKIGSSKKYSVLQQKYCGFKNCNIEDIATDKDRKNSNRTKITRFHKNYMKNAKTNVPLDEDDFNILTNRQFIELYKQFSGRNVLYE